MRTAAGEITTFDVPTTCTTAAPPAHCAFNGTFPGGVNVLGTIVGTYFGEDGNPTDPVSINDWGQITGIAFDANFVTHGLYVIP